MPKNVVFGTATTATLWALSSLEEINVFLLLLFILSFLPSLTDEMIHQQTQTLLNLLQFKEGYVVQLVRERRGLRWARERRTRWLITFPLLLIEVSFDSMDVPVPQPTRQHTMEVSDDSKERDSAELLKRHSASPKRVVLLAHQRTCSDDTQTVRLVGLLWAVRGPKLTHRRERVKQFKATIIIIMDGEKSAARHDFNRHTTTVTATSRAITQHITEWKVISSSFIGCLFVSLPIIVAVVVKSLLLLSTCARSLINFVTLPPLRWALLFLFIFFISCRRCCCCLFCWRWSFLV